MLLGVIFGMQGRFGLFLKQCVLGRVLALFGPFCCPYLLFGKDRLFQYVELYSRVAKAV